MYGQMPQRPLVPEIEPREAWERSERGEAVIVDVRQPEELDQVSVESAVHIPLGDLPTALSQLPRDSEILVLCRSGNRSAYATEYLLQAGFPKVRNIVGGIIDWANAGLPYRWSGEE